MNTNASQDIRGVLISVSGGKLMLPNATVAEVITYANPEPVVGAPAWLLGRVRWRGWGLPIVSYSEMVGWPEEGAALGAKVAVLKGVGNHAKMPYFAVLTQGFPRLITIAESELSERSARDAWLPDGIYSEATFHGDDCVIPDLAAIEARIAGALQGAGTMAAA
ncbi:MAG: chemotaxis protein CheW [Proteobacteria bacterium]|nr:chemotaxis protein CheW [Pseudomonadota bacterium]MBS0460996.1 chemotaxis protein CheW [Pseudomonadota bacterium]MBS0463534.1 chemotaxis protein CheW [Pseudomonadota bacterium]